MFVKFFSHTDQFFQYRQILYGYKPINKLKEISVETEIWSGNEEWKWIMNTWEMNWLNATAFWVVVFSKSPATRWATQMKWGWKLLP